MSSIGKERESSFLSVVNSSTSKPVPAPVASSKTSKSPPRGDQRPNNTTTTSPSPSSSSSSMPPLPSLPARLDFIGPSQAVKDLFALPYATEREVSVAVHNMGGTLLIDADPRMTATGGSLWPRPNHSRRRPRPDPNRSHGANHHGHAAPAPPTTTTTSTTTSSTSSTVMLLPQAEGGDEDDEQQNQALALVASVIDQKSLTLSNPPSSSNTPTSSHSTNEDTVTNDNLSLPRPEEYTLDVLPPLPEPREYLSWKFREYNLLVGTDALIYRDVTNNNNNNSNTSSTSSLPSPADDDGNNEAASNNKALPPPTATTTSSTTSSSVSSQALTVRIEEVSKMQSLVAKHQDMVRKGEFVADYHLPLWQQRGKASYAQAVAASDKSNNQSKTNNNTSSALPSAAPPALPVAGSFAAPNLDQERLQTCIVPSYRSPLGGLLSPATTGRHSQDTGTTLSPSAATTMASPVCTVLDAYLDNIMANVPQLALCLRERGFIQSVKLLQTNDIPSGLLHPSAVDLSRPFANVVVPKDNSNSSSSSADDDGALFSPHIMEMNAATLLRFLKTNCTRDNVTYLLRRPVNQTNIELYDISSISTQRQRQWIWWLATMSYRFALRLGHLTCEPNPATTSPSSTWKARQAQLRSFRLRQRSLFQNALDLLEELRDMDGGAHETLVAAICEHLADSYLTTTTSSSSSSGAPNAESSSSSSSTAAAAAASASPTKVPISTGTTAASSPTTTTETKVEPPPTCKEREQPYAAVTVDALNKAQDYLLRAIQILKPLLQNMSGAPSPQEDAKKTQQQQDRRPSDKSSSSSQQQQQHLLVVSVRRDDDDDDDDDSPNEEEKGNDDEDDDETDSTFPTDTIKLQLFGLHHKLINVALQLAEHHLHNYWSSSAMQSLRTSARHLADAMIVLDRVEDVSEDPDNINNDSTTQQQQQQQQQQQHKRPLLWQYRRSLQVQYTWLWEHCGHFARSFAADENWRDRGHAAGDDVVSLLQDVEAAFVCLQQRKTMDWCSFVLQPDQMFSKSKGMVSLQSLSALIDPWLVKSDGPANDSQSHEGQEGVSEATKLFMGLGQIARDKRRVLVAACVSYCRAISAYQDLVKADPGNTMPTTGETFVVLLQQRLGDTCNETGKVLLTQLRQFLTRTTPASNGNLVADVLLSSAEFWFKEGLEVFTKCEDLRNVALLRCNLCQCYKLRANSNFASHVLVTESGSHSESCLEQAVHHLEKAHEALGVRDTDSRTWDMVSEELASTFLVLGVRRRQSLLGGGTTPIVIQAFRLTPGKEKSIVHPMERSLSIYQQLGNLHQAAAVHYQLALFFSKVWTCQRDEVKTREKLAAAFKHFSCAHSYFFNAPPGNEPTFVLLCLDLSGLYSAVSGKECLDKALSCCLDTGRAFAQDSVGVATTKDSVEWFEKMETLASSVEDRVFKLLKELVRLERETSSEPPKFKELYRVALTLKAGSSGTEATFRGERLLATHRLLMAVKAQHIRDT